MLLNGFIAHTARSGHLTLCVCVCAQSCYTLCDPQASLSMEFSRQEYWSGLPHPPPGNLLDWRIKPVSPALAGRFFITEPPGQPYFPSGCWLPNEGLLSTPGAGAGLETFTCWDAMAFPPVARQPLNCAVSLDLPILDTLYQWHSTTCGLLWPASLTEHHVFKGPLCHKGYKDSIPFDGWGAHHGLYSPCFMCPLLVILTFFSHFNLRKLLSNQSIV